MSEPPQKPAVGAACNGCGLCCRLEVCSAGAYTLGLVDELGARVPGPCPALTAQPDGTQVCGLMLRPRDHADGAAHDLRRAVGLLIGAGAGCDEAGDDDDPRIDAAIDQIQRAYIARHGRATLRAAAERWYGSLRRRT